MDGKLIKGIHHVCMKVEDIDKSVQFYTENFGYTVRLKWDGGAMLNAPDGTRLEFFLPDEQKGYAHVAYVCDEVDKAYDQAVECGCSPVSAPIDFTIPSKPALNVRIAFIKDPAGNIIELFHEYA